MNKNLSDAGISFPDFWDEVKVLNAFNTLESVELREYFGCSNGTSFTRMMKPHFPNRPEKSSYSKYIKEILSKSMTEQVSSSVSKFVSEEEFLKAHLNDTPMKLKAFLKTLTQEQADKFNLLQRETSND